MPATLTINRVRRSHYVIIPKKLVTWWEAHGYSITQIEMQDEKDGRLTLVPIRDTSLQDKAV